MARRQERLPPVDAIETRPIQCTSKQGTLGASVTLQANFFRLTNVPDWTLYQYRVDIAPEEERTRFRKVLLRAHANVLGSYMFDGTVLYTNQLLRQPLELQSIRDDGQPVKITVKLVGDLVKGDHHYFQLFNMIIRKALEHLQLQLVHRNYYDAVNRIAVNQFKLELWPGYVTSIRQHDAGIMLCAEISHKVMRTDTLLDILNEVHHRNRTNYQREFSAAVIGSVVLTNYNNRTYNIDDVDYAVNPRNTFRTNDGGAISYVDYYRQKYQVEIRDTRQPLLVSRSRARDRRAGADEIIYLIPELCCTTGFTDDMKTNYPLMNAVARHTRLAPRDRIEKLRSFNERLNGNAQIVQDFGRWNFDLSRDLLTLRGRVLPMEPIVFGQNKLYHLGEKTDWNFATQASLSVIVGQLNDWILIVPRMHTPNIEHFITSLTKAGSKIGFTIRRPIVKEISDDRHYTYATELEKVTKERNPQLICCIVSNNQLQRYSTIKKKLCLDRPIPSQVVLARTLIQRSATMMNAVACKIAVQMNCKIGGVPWTLNVEKNLMIVGFDVCHNKKNPENNFGAMVASLNQNYGRYFSAVSRHGSGEELSNDIALHLGRAVDEYRRLNNKLPFRIVIYRDGVGEGQIPFVHDYEVSQIKKRLSAIYGGDDKFKLAVVIVTKRIIPRFFLNGGNPPPGTVVDDVVTDPLKYDFFIVSQCVRQGTVSPTAYNIIEDTTGFSPDRMQKLTYQLCYLYYNFTGRVSVPAPCQYAHKLALLVSQAVHQPPHERLNKLLYFL